MSDEAKIQKDWWVYVLLSKNEKSLDHTYVGSTNDLNRRLRQHNGVIKGGAKSTIIKRPWIIGKVYGPYSSRSEAFKAEMNLKRTKRGAGRLRWSKEDSILCKEIENERSK